MAIFDCRNQKDGVQVEAVAWAMFRLRGVQVAYRDQKLHPPRAGNILCSLLRGEIRYSLRQMQQGTYLPTEFTLV